METIRARRPLFGALMLVLSGVIWSFSGVLSKGLAWNGFSKVGVRGIVAIFIYALVRRSFKVKLTKNLVIGALGVALTSLLYIVALGYTTSANAIVLQYSMPVFVVLASWFLFKQAPRRVDVITIAVVLIGVILCCAQGMSGGALFGNMLALVSGLTYAVVFLASRFPGNDPVAYTYLGNCFSALMAVSLFFDPNVHFCVSPGIDAAAIWADLLRALAMGLSLSFGYLCFAYGIRHTTPLAAAILENVEPVLNPIWVFLAFGENPGVLGILGAVVVLGAVTVYACLPFLRRRTL